MRRFYSCSHWGLVDVTPFPYCVPLDSTVLVDIWHDAREDYDGTE